MVAVDDMEDWAHQYRLVCGLNRTTMVDRMIMCVRVIRMAINFLC